ncbi:tryptophan halogenase family protein [Altererythrobacter sp. MTPC7]|uniref:tryptophan halogenase family protein n=1 Tax=Altererythrobacter sp. MTPC7 TaxID=3056567 RepID=UPI0036F2285D
MTKGRIRRVVIVGGGTAGWMTAAGLSRALGQSDLSITLVESDAIGTVGVGEATLPQIRDFNRLAGIDEREMMARTAATIKLGIEFCDWGEPGTRYIHPFGTYGEAIGPAPFHHYWLAEMANGNVRDFGEYSLPIVAARAGRFEPPAEEEGLGAYNYAFQFDAGLYAAYLSDVAQRSGVRRHEGRIVEVESDGETGEVAAVVMETGERIEGDLFIDCSGFRALLIEQELQTGFEDWSHWLPCNRAWAVPCATSAETAPYTRATAREAGWQWRIPLQHRVGNGHVYCDRYISDDAAAETLLANLEAEPIAEPRQLRFTTGKRRRMWSRNVVAIGLSGGFLEPLESTSIDLIQSGILNLVTLFPAGAIDEADVSEYNRLMDLEYDRIRDFLMLHYVLNARHGQRFWDDMREMELPASLAEKIDAFRQRGLTPDYQEGLFLQQSWLSVFIGQGAVPEAFDPRVTSMSASDRHARMERIHSAIAGRAGRLEPHLSFIGKYGAAYRGEGIRR